LGVGWDTAATFVGSQLSHEDSEKFSFTEESPMRLRIPVLLVATALVITACQSSPSSPETPTEARRDNASTFALDVDTASYTFAARTLNDGSWPQVSSVRPEEFLNAFDHHYAQPRGDGFAMHVDGSRLPESHSGSSSSRLVRIGLQTKAESSSERSSEWGRVPK
jgi:Ca-activated chloride channel family protein